MALTAGTRIGPYEILTSLGAGGMGEVYRAIDSNLKRQVAIKVLPPALGAEPERVSRFQREAEVLAALNHPHIANIYGLEKSDGALALVMELVEGPTLAEQIAQGPIPFAEAASIARQIAEALEAAHEQGIVHRDLKPANIKVRPDGTVKVLDFGLAKAMDQAAASRIDVTNSPTVHATQLGVILGTAAYMSPEQARGARVDGRADIWAFGCVLYEMLTGSAVFARGSITDTLATITRDDPDWTTLPPTTPDRVRRLLVRCLQRDVKQRLQAIGEARIVLDATDDQASSAAPSHQSQSPPSARRPPVFWVASAVVALVAAVMGWRLGPTDITSPAVSRLSVLLPIPLSTRVADTTIALSPDGAVLAYVGTLNGTDSLYVRRMDEIEVKPLRGTEGASNPVFSPDGAWVAFVSDRKLKKVPVLGGSPIVLNEGNPDAFSLDWSPDGGIIFARGFTLGLARVPSSGGDAQMLMAPDPSKGESSYLWPRVMQGGRDLLFVINPDNNASFDEGRIALETLGKAGTRAILDAQGSAPLYTSSGHLVFFSSGSVRAAPFDLRQRKLTGPAVPVVEGVSIAPHTGAVQAAISRSGTLAYAADGGQIPKTSLVLVDLNGQAQSLTDALPGLLGEVSVSSDGQRVALRSAKANDDIHVFEMSRGSFTRFTYEGGDEQSPVWTPDGKRLAYASQRGGTPAMFWKQADGNGNPEQILAPQYPHRPSSFSPDGKVLAYTEVHPQSGLDIWTVRLDDGSPRRAEPFLRTRFDEDLPLFSPDGRWVAYRSQESGRMEVYIAQFPGADVKRQISIDGGDQPLWAPDGKRLFYINGSRIMSADIAIDSSLDSTKPRLIFERTMSPSSPDSAWWGHTWAVLPDGKRFLFVESPPRPQVRELRVVLNWFEELKVRVPTK